MVDASGPGPGRSSPRVAALKESAQNQAFEVQILEMKKYIISEMGDALGDLTEDQVHAIAVIRVADMVTFGDFGGLPQSRAWVDQFMSLSRSRNRLGRVEATGLINRPIIPPDHSARHREDIEDEREYREQSQRKGGLMSMFRRKRD